MTKRSRLTRVVGVLALLAALAFLAGCGGGGNKSSSGGSSSGSNSGKTYPVLRVAWDAPDYMIAMALACNPDVLIADEPTTALDVTIQAQIIELIDRLKDEFNSAVILITHDLGVVADVADEIIVMYAGRVVERATTRDLFYDPQMPYTWGLLGSIPRLDRPRQERLHSIKGTPPSLIRSPTGCKFRPRCPHGARAPSPSTRLSIALWRSLDSPTLAS